MSVLYYIRIGYAVCEFEPFEIVSLSNFEFVLSVTFYERVDLEKVFVVVQSL